jgi:hypothetical protein
MFIFIARPPQLEFFYVSRQEHTVCLFYLSHVCYTSSPPLIPSIDRPSDTLQTFTLKFPLASEYVFTLILGSPLLPDMPNRLDVILLMEETTCDTCGSGVVCHIYVH